MFGRITGLLYNEGGGGGGGNGFYARVTDIITDSNHPRYEDQQQTLGLYGVFFKPIGDALGGTADDIDENQFFAYCQRDTIVRLPVIGEIVEIYGGPDWDRTTDASEGRDYWRTIVNIWNHPNHNASTIEEPDFGDDFKESTKVNPLQLFPGDALIEGRHGNTIRLGGTNFDTNPFSEEDNNGSPFVILRTGQKEADDSIETVVEDPNEDKSSIYMMSDHTVKLEQAHEKRDAFEDEPEKADTHKGPQVIVNSGRLYFNARDEGAFISAKEMIGLNSKVIGIDSDDYIGMDSKKIYLGSGAFDEDEPALKGETTTTWLDDLVSLLESLAKTLATSPPAPAELYTAKLVKEGGSLLKQLPRLKQILKQLHSKKVFIDKK